MLRRSDLGRDRWVRTAYRVGWKVAPWLPTPARRSLIAVGSRLAVRRGGRHLATLRRNLEVVTGGPIDDDVVRAAVASYLRTILEMLMLPNWSSGDVVGRVSVSQEAMLRSAFAEHGAVVALPHSGNWDLAGAWAGATGMPVTTVAERLPDADYAAFLAYRERLGMEVLSHTDPGTIAALAGAVRRGRVVCLIADRDLASAGVEVIWAGRRVTMPAGPALVARRTGAVLIPAVCQYDGLGMRVNLGPPVPNLPGRVGLQQMTQQVADFFSAEIARQPEDWHMFQPFFPDETRLAERSA